MIAKELHEDTYSKTIFGFWTYLMTDCVLFATLFATHAVLKDSPHWGPTAAELFSLPYALAETLILLTSSFTCGLVMLALQNHDRKKIIFWLAVTFVLGMIFLGMELHEFAGLIRDGNGWQRSAFLSSFFTLVSTHGLHITFGLLWIAVMAFQMLAKGITAALHRQLACLSMFWHFLDVIWIFIFTFVYLLGVK